MVSLNILLVDLTTIHTGSLKLITYNCRTSSNIKKGVDQDIVESLKIFIRLRLIMVHVEEFQIGVESYQKNVNLTPLMLACPGIQRVKKWSCFEKQNLGLCLVFLTEKMQKRLFRVNEIAKFSKGTLIWIMEKVDEEQRLMLSRVV